VIYPIPKTKPVFWRPFAVFGREEFSLGWLWVYILVYTPLMFLAKWVLRIP